MAPNLGDPNVVEVATKVFETLSEEKMADASKPPHTDARQIDGHAHSSNVNTHADEETAMRAQPHRHTHIRTHTHTHTRARTHTNVPSKTRRRLLHVLRGSPTPVSLRQVHVRRILDAASHQASQGVRTHTRTDGATIK